MFKKIDDELNSYAVHRIVEYFLMLGLACFLSMCITTVGVIRSTTNSGIISSSIPTLVSASGETAILDYEFAGYNNWNNFTSNCCCQYEDPFTNGTLKPQVVEIWKW